MNQLAQTKLNRQWLLFAISSLTLTLCFYLFLRQQWHPFEANQWLLLTTLALVGQLGILRWGLQYNHPKESLTLLPTLGYGNGLTLLRGFLLCLMAGFLFSPRPQDTLLAWLPALLYLSASLLDHFDGYVARITHHTTRLGEILDMEFDGVGILIAITLGIQYGQLPLWYLLLGLGRQLFLLGMWIRTREGKPNHALPPSDNRRLIAGIQMGFIAVLLWPVFTPPATTVASLIFGAMLAFSFGRDWLVVCGITDADGLRYQVGRQWIKRLFEGWLPMLLRPIGTCIALFILLEQLPVFTSWQVFQRPPTMVGPVLPILMGLAVLSPLALPLFLLGILPRIATLPLLGLACLDIFAYGFAWEANGALLAITLIVINVGGGLFSLWNPEERILRQRAGDLPEGEA